MWACRFDEQGHKRVRFGQGATIDVLTDASAAQLAAVRVTVAAGARMPEHDHGSSDALLVPLTGRLTLRDRDGEVQLAPGAITFIAAGERVSVENPSEEPASMVVCFAPPTFVARLVGASRDGATIEPLDVAETASP